MTARETRKIEGQVRLAGAADTVLGATPGEFEWLVVVERPAHDVFDFLAVAGFERVSHAAKTSFSRTGGNVKRECGHDVPREVA